MIGNQIKTVLLLGLMTGLMLGLGYLVGGNTGLFIMLIFSLLMNLVIYLFSHKLVLLMYQAQEADLHKYKELHKMVEEISRKAGIPKPKVYIIPSKNPNAFATGPSPGSAVVAFSEGILNLLNDEELKGVAAHEISHIKNRDMLIMTIAVALATIISYFAAAARFAAFFGDKDNDHSYIELLILGILSPIIALLIQLAISRSREYIADETGARLVHNSEGLARALEKLEKGNEKTPLHNGNEVTSSLFIVNPFVGSAFFQLFSTHPDVASRVKRLRTLKL